MEHHAHCRYVARVPLGDVAVEGAVFEHLRHVHHVACIPTGDIAIECGILEQRLHIRDVGYIDEIQIHAVTMRRHCRIDQLFEMIAITGNDGVGCTHRIIVPQVTDQRVVRWSCRSKGYVQYG